MSTPTPEREQLSPETRAALNRGLAQSAAGEVVNLGTFSTPERVTLTDEERASLADAFDHEVEANCWSPNCDAGIWESVERILAAREQALREEIGGEVEAALIAPLDHADAGYNDGVRTAARIARGAR